MIVDLRSGGMPVFVLDAGNTLFSGSRQDVNQASEGRLMVAAMNQMGYDALALGPDDLDAGPEVLRERMDEASFAVLSANVELDGQPFAEPYALIERDGIKVAVLGLTSGPDKAGVFTVSDPLAAARRYLPELRRQADVVVVLANVGTEGEPGLTAAAAAADVILNGGFAGPSRPATGTTMPALARAGGLGEYLGNMELRLDDANHAVAYGYESLLLGPEYKDDPEMARLKEEYVAEYLK